MAASPKILLCLQFPSSGEQGLKSVAQGTLRGRIGSCFGYNGVMWEGLGWDWRCSQVWKLTSAISLSHLPALVFFVCFFFKSGKLWEVQFSQIMNQILQMTSWLLNHVHIFLVGTYDFPRACIYCPQDPWGTFLSIVAEKAQVEKVARPTHGHSAGYPTMY